MLVFIIVPRSLKCLAETTFLQTRKKFLLPALELYFRACSRKGILSSRQKAGTCGMLASNMRRCGRNFGSRTFPKCIFMTQEAKALTLPNWREPKVPTLNLPTCGRFRRPKNGLWCFPLKGKPLSHTS